MRTGRVPAVAAAAAVVGLIVAGQFVDGHHDGPMTQLTATMALAYTPMGLLVLAGVPGHRVGRLLLAAGGAAALAIVAVSWSHLLVPAWIAQWSWWPPFGLVFLAVLMFLDGPVRRRTAVAVAGGTAFATVALALAALDHPRDLLTDVIAFTPRAQLLVRAAAVGVLVAVIGLLAGLWALFRQWRRASDGTRPQLAYLLAGGLLYLFGLALDALNVPGAQVVVAAAVPLAMTVAVVRHRLYGLDRVVNRTVVWLVMTMLVVAGYVALVWALRLALVGGETSTAALLATGLIAVAFEPLRRLVQRAVDRMLYGDRDDPYAVIAGLGERLGRAVEPDRVLPLLTGTIADSLRVPYVAVTDGSRLLAEHGEPHAPDGRGLPDGGAHGADVQAFEMVSHGRAVGRLLVARRAPGVRFTNRESRLLRDLALRAAAAVEATQLVRDLRESRERLVSAREEERRRLRRELHDGVGPSLLGMSMQVRAAQRLAGPASDLLAAVQDDLRTCSGEVRRLVDQLRPAALDGGLAAALRTECDRFAGTALDVRLNVDGPTEGLPAAVEVAAYRIVAEALANVVRHADAVACLVTVARDAVGDLSLEITDDGVGVPSGGPQRRGVGLDSMRQRAEELGGTYAVGPGERRGTAVRVTLPALVSA